MYVVAAVVVERAQRVKRRANIFDDVSRRATFFWVVLIRVSSRSKDAEFLEFHKLKPKYLVNNDVHDDHFL